MIQTLALIDHALPTERALQMRNDVIASGFKDGFYMKGKYKSCNMEIPMDDLYISLSDFFGRPIVPTLGAFRLGHEDTDLHTNIHADNPVARWAAVYYLNLPDQCRGGTAFYKHKAQQWDSMPTKELLDERGITLDEFKESWTKDEDWDIISIAGMKFNRMCVYPTQMFHSRYPLKGWGNEKNPEECRLIAAMFFDVK